MHVCVHPYISQQILSICLALITAGRRSETLTTPSSCKSSGKWAPGLRGGRPNYSPQAEKSTRSQLTLGLQRIQHESQHQKKPGSASPVACWSIAVQQQEPPWAMTSHEVPHSPRSCSSPFRKAHKQPSINAIASHSFIEEQLFQTERNTTMFPTCIISAR